MTEQYVQDGDVGCGKPGDPAWHTCVLLQLEDKEIAEYMQKSLNVDISERELALEYVRGLSK